MWGVFFILETTTNVNLNQKKKPKMKIRMKMKIFANFPSKNDVIEWIV